MGGRLVGAGPYDDELERGNTDDSAETAGMQSDPCGRDVTSKDDAEDDAEVIVGGVGVIRDLLTRDAKETRDVR